MITCLMRAYVLREVMLCRRKYLMGGHVLVKYMFSEWLSFNMLCFAGRHVLQEDMFS